VNADRSDGSARGRIRSSRVCPRVFLRVAEIGIDVVASRSSSAHSSSSARGEMITGGRRQELVRQLPRFALGQKPSTNRGSGIERFTNRNLRVGRGRMKNDRRVDVGGQVNGSSRRSRRSHPLNGGRPLTSPFGELSAGARSHSEGRHLWIGPSVALLSRERDSACLGLDELVPGRLR